MAYSTCNNYLKRYTDVTALKAGIQRHASSNGVQINLEENINDIARFRQGIPRQKRPIAKNILEAPQPKRARIATANVVYTVFEEPQAGAPATVIEELQAAVVTAPPAIAGTSGNYNNKKEIVCFETQEDVYKLMGAMQRSCRNKDSVVSVELKRIEAEVEIKKMEADVEIKKMELLMQDKITFEQYLQIK